MSKMPMPDRYATLADFCRVFTHDTASLYLLSLLLTGNQTSAEKCFVSSVADTMPKKAVFKEWARPYVRRIIVQNAIRMLKPAAHGGSDGSDSVRDASTRDLAPELSPVLRLDRFERFVFVLAILERYSIHECSLLLSCSNRQVLTARINALRTLAMFAAQPIRLQRTA
jgi:hypothetical protein